jgi:hypothetical protein
VTLRTKVGINVGINLGTLMALGPARQAPWLATIGPEDAHKLRANALVQQRLGGSFSRRLIGSRHQAGHKAVGEFQQMGFTAAVLAVNHVEPAELDLHTGENREVADCESVEHHRRMCGRTWFSPQTSGAAVLLPSDFSGSLPANASCNTASSSLRLSCSPALSCCSS